MSACGRGICCANDGHKGTCAEASGWDREADWTPAELSTVAAARTLSPMTAEPSVRDQAETVLRSALYSTYGQGDYVRTGMIAAAALDALAAAGLLAGEAS